MNYIPLTNYPLEYFKPLFSNNRWEEITKVVTNWMHPELKDGRIYESILMNPETMTSFNVGVAGEVSNHMMEYMQKQVLEKYLSEDEVKMCNSTAKTAYRDARDAKKFDAATKIEETDFSGPIFHGDTFYYDGIDELRDGWDYDEPLPDYVNASTIHHTLNGCDLEYFIASMIERVGEINDEYVNVPTIPEYLQLAWDKFVDENSREYYLCDHTTVIITDKTLNHNTHHASTND